MNTTATATVSFKKLNDGSWGLVSTHRLTPGTTVGVTRRDGSVTTVTVGFYITATTDTVTERWYYRISKAPKAEPVVKVSDCELDRGGHRCGGCSLHRFGMGRGGYAGD